MIHAWYIILNNPEQDYESVPDGERQGNSRTTYYYVSRGGPQPQGASGQMNYGTVGAQPSGGQFPGQQTGAATFKQQSQGAKVQAHQGVAGQEAGAGESSSGAPSGPPPTYADVIKGDHKQQTS